MSFSAHPALYQVVAEDATPPGTARPAVLINLFEVSPEADDDFLEAWERSREVMRSRPGYLGTRLHRSLSPEADFRFVNIAPWESPEVFQAAIGEPAFREAAASIRPRAHTPPSTRSSGSSPSPGRAGAAVRRGSGGRCRSSAGLIAAASSGLANR